MTAPFATIGHSNRSAEEVIDMLRAAQIATLADVRAFPRSRTNPAFNIDTFPDHLAAHQIGYRHFPALGGRRKLQPNADERLNTLWREQSFRNYADYALGPDFAAAFDDLVRLAEKGRVAIMCAEAVWWRCHRRIITDYLIANGFAVDHIMGADKTDPAKMTPGAQATAEGKVLYPPEQRELPL